MKTNTISKVLLLAFILILTSNCKKEDPPIDDTPTPGDKIAFIINEGKFQANNGSITLLNLTKKTFSTEYFKAVNNFQLGDIVQSMGETDDKYFIVVNNSAKIEVVNKSSFESLFSIEDMGSPRYFLAINDTLAYVSDLFANAVHQINPNNGNKYADIAVNGWSEQMQQIDNEVFVTLFGANAIGVINIGSQAITEMIELDLSPGKMVKDKFNKLWVMASVFGGSSKLYKINAENRTIENEWEFTVNEPITQLAIDPEGSFIYYGSFSDGGKVTVNTLDVSFNGNTLSPDQTIEPAVQSLYGLSINSQGDVFVCDALDFSKKGVVYIHHSDAEIPVDSIPAGFNPNSVVFSN